MLTVVSNKKLLFVALSDVLLDIGTQESIMFMKTLGSSFALFDDISLEYVRERVEGWPKIVIDSKFDSHGVVACSDRLYGILDIVFCCDSISTLNPVAIREYIFCLIELSNDHGRTSLARKLGFLRTLVIPADK